MHVKLHMLFMLFILLQWFSKDSNNLHHTLNNSKVLAHSVHIPTCFGGGHHHHQGVPAFLGLRTAYILCWFFYVVTMLIMC